MKNIKWNGDKQDFLQFAQDYVVNIHERCRNPKTPEDRKLKEQMINVEIQIIGTVKGEDVLEIRFVKKPIPTAEEYIKNHYEVEVKNHFLNFDKQGIETYTEYAIKNPLKTLEEGFIEFATMHVQACKLHIANLTESSDYGKFYFDKETILNAYPESNIK